MDTLALIQEPPDHPVYEAQDDCGLLFLVRDLQREDLPEDMSLSFQGNLFHFRTRVERMQFSLGLGLGVDLLQPLRGC